MSSRKLLPVAALTALLACAPAAALAATEHYTIDPEHTFPSFEADHMGISIWRGKFNTTRGTATLDKAADTGAVTGGMVDITVDLASVDFGHDKLNEHAQGPDLFDVAEYRSEEHTSELQSLMRNSYAVF